HLDRELLRLDRLAGPALRALVHVRVAVAFRDILRIIEPHAFVVGAQRPIPFVETVVGRPAPVLGADVPFALDRAGIARLSQDRSNGLLPAHDTAGIAAKRDGMVAG